MISEMVSQDETQLKISSCHQRSQVASREMRRDGVAARFKVLERLAQSGWGGIRAIRRLANLPTLPTFVLGGRKQPLPPGTTPFLPVF